MNVTTIARPQLSLHCTPTWRTTPPRCLTCAQPIWTLAEWLNAECPGAPAREEAA